MLHRDRLVSFVGGDDALAHLARALRASVHRRQRLLRRSGGALAALGGLFRTFLQTPRATPHRLRLALSHALGMALLW